MNKFSVILCLAFTLVLLSIDGAYSQSRLFYLRDSNRLIRWELRNKDPHSAQVKGVFGGAKDSWTTRDKLDHLLGSAMLSGGGFLALKVTRNGEHQSFVLSVGLVTCLGVLKEVYDAGHPPEQSSWKDLVADIIGAGLGAVIARSL